MTPEKRIEHKKQGRKVGSGKDKEDRIELYDKTKELLKEKVRQIDANVTDTDTTLGSDVYVIFPIDED